MWTNWLRTQSLRGDTKKVQTKKVLDLYHKNYPNITKPNHFVQSYILYALTPAAGCQDHYKQYWRLQKLIAQRSVFHALEFLCIRAIFGSLNPPLTGQASELGFHSQTSKFLAVEKLAELCFLPRNPILTIQMARNFSIAQH